MSTNEPTCAGMSQVILPTPTDAETEASADVKRSFDFTGTDIRVNDHVGVAIEATEVLKHDDILTLSKNQKLEMAHKGFVEVEKSWKTEPTWEEVTDDDGTRMQFDAAGDTGGSEMILGQVREDNELADDDDGIVVTNNGTFTAVTGTLDVGDGVPDSASDEYRTYTSYYYDGNASSSSANDGFVGPATTGAAANAQQTIIMNLPGLNNGVPMSEDTKTVMSAQINPVEVTHVSAMETIAAVANETVTLTLPQLVDAGVPSSALLSTKTVAYQDAIIAAGASGADTISKLANIIYGVNNA